MLLKSQMPKAKLAMNIHWNKDFTRIDEFIHSATHHWPSQRMTQVFRRGTNQFFIRRTPSLFLMKMECETPSNHNQINTTTLYPRNMLVLIEMPREQLNALLVKRALSARQFHIMLCESAENRREKRATHYLTKLPIPLNMIQQQARSTRVTREPKSNKPFPLLVRERP